MRATIFFDGEERHFRDINDSEALGIIIIHQELALVPLLSIAENIFLGNEPARFRRHRPGRGVSRARESCWTRSGCSEPPDTLVTDLGVGKQQLVEIAKALSKKVRLLILDEPTASLNESDSDALLDLLLAFKEQGIASILISHKLNEVAQVADRITVLRDGRTVDTHRLPQRAGQRGPDHPQHGRPRPRPPLSGARAEDRRAGVRGRGLVASTIRSTPSGR